MSIPVSINKLSSKPSSWNNSASGHKAEPLIETALALYAESTIPLLAGESDSERPIVLAEFYSGPVLAAWQLGRLPLGTGVPVGGGGNRPGDVLKVEESR